MTGSPRAIAAAVGGLVLLCQVPAARAQSSPQAVTRVSSVLAGSIGGIVQDEKGAPIEGAMVSALGAKTATAVTDRSGRYEIRTLTPGRYLVRAHISGYVGSRGQIVEVRASVRTSSSIALRTAARAGGSAPTVPASLPLVAAGVGGALEAQVPAPSAPEPPERPAEVADSTVEDDHGETAWRL